MKDNFIRVFRSQEEYDNFRNKENKASKEFLKECNQIREMFDNKRNANNERFFGDYTPNYYFKPEDEKMDKIKISVADIVDGKVDLKFKNEVDKVKCSLDIQSLSKSTEINNKDDIIKIGDEIKTRYQNAKGIRLSCGDKVVVNKRGLEDREFSITRKLKHGFYELTDDIKNRFSNKYKAHEDIIFIKTRVKTKPTTLEDYNINCYDEYVVKCIVDRYEDLHVDKVVGNIVNFNPRQIVIETEDGLYINKTSNIVYMKKKPIILSNIKEI